MIKNKIPVTIITGFLGSGKTTLLNNIVKQFHHKKFAIIENECGDVGIDGDLILGESDAIFELNNGCICCSLQDGFVNTINKLLNSPHQFDHLLIETTGIANPDSVIGTFIATEAIQQKFVIDSVICVADAVNIEDFINDQPEVRKQLALADITLINKADSVQKSYLQDLQQLIAAINPMSRIHKVSYSNISEISILDNYYFTSEAIEQKTADFPFANGLKLDTSQLLGRHDITAEGFLISGDIDMEKFESWMKGFLFFNSHAVFRAKGILSTTESKQKLVFQSIGTSYQLEYGKAWSNEQHFNKFIFIGKYIDREMIESSLMQTLVNPIPVNQQ
ncbi:CobW family GTP-binding protein [Carboxylicivirga sp. RSCT41]|uniref:CobW family GTP-binding protein n=1 Tax=Carboxylicivirga agarovorans TaxID=3417570 RepID=UPI003D334576